MTRSLFKGGKSRVPKETKDDPILIRQRTRTEWTQAAIERDNERRKKEREGGGPTPKTKLGPLNMEVQEG